MEYEYFVDQISKQTENPSATALGLLSPDLPVDQQIQSEVKVEPIHADAVIETKTEDTVQQKPEESVPPVSITVADDLKEATTDSAYRTLLEKVAFDQVNLPARTLPLADAFLRRQRYVDSLLTCCSATRQCAEDRDALTYLRFRAKNESIVCELRNARGRFAGRVGRLRMPLTHKLDIHAHRLLIAIIVFFVCAVLTYVLFVASGLLHAAFLLTQPRPY